MAFHTKITTILEIVCLVSLLEKCIAILPPICFFVVDDARYCSLSNNNHNIKILHFLVFLKYAMDHDNCRKYRALIAFNKLNNGVYRFESTSDLPHHNKYTLIKATESLRVFGQITAVGDC